MFRLWLNGTEVALEAGLEAAPTPLIEAKAANGRAKAPDLEPDRRGGHPPGAGKPFSQEEED
jgi:hypothetical protein